LKSGGHILNKFFVIQSAAIILFFFSGNPLLGQAKLEKGVYFGKDIAFLRCYLDVKDSVSTIDVFDYKGGQYFGHDNTKYLSTPKTPQKDLLLADAHDSVKVYRTRSSIKLKLKGQATIKMQLTNWGDTVISKSRANYLLFQKNHPIQAAQGIKQ
jgi:hypothetical protein